MVNVIETYFPLYVLVLVRLASFLMTAPLFSYRTIPARDKIGLALFFSFIITFGLSADLSMIETYFINLLLKEAIIGLMLGLVAALLIYSVQVAGAFIDLQMGFAFASVVDPQTGTRVPLTGRFLYLIISAVLYTLVLDREQQLLQP